MIKIQFAVFFLLYCAVVSSTTGYKDSDFTKKVFAHVMVEYTDSMDQNFFDSQIKREKSVGIDEFALYVGRIEGEPDDIVKALAAAANNDNFSMFISFDIYLENVTPTVLLAEQLHCSPNDLTCFRSRSVDEIIAAQAEVNQKFTLLNPSLIDVLESVLSRFLFKTVARFLTE
jgi:hypothetical protein